MMYDIGVYLDYGPDIGLGHLVRCAGLARSARALGYSTKLITSTVGEVPPFCGKDFDCVTVIPKDGVLDEFELQSSVTWLIVDHYEPCREILAKINAKHILGLKDFLGQSLDFADRILESIPPKDSAVLTSYDEHIANAPFLLLRSEFSDARFSALLDSTFRRSQNLGHIFVSLGGGNSANFIAELIGKLALKEFQLSVVVSSMSGHHKALANIASDACTVLVDQNASQIAQLINKADLAICSAGVTAWEVSTLGLPSILVKMAENQTNNTDMLVAAGCSVLAGSIDDQNISDRVIAIVDRLSHSRDQFSNLVENTVNVSDGLGCNRVLSWLFPSYDKEHNLVLLRPAALDDLEITYEWQCQPETRTHSRNPNIPSWENHMNWFTGKLNDPNCLYSIVQVADQRAGVVRLDIIDCPENLLHINETDENTPRVFEISIHIASTFFRRGLASAALKAARRLLPGVTIVAFVDKKNDASLRLFSGAGYEQFGSWFVARPYKRS